MRLVKANHLDLTRFQFDYDLTFAALFMNSDWTVYGRYGTRRSVQEAGKEMTTAGLAKSMQAALTLHKGFPRNRTFVAGKQPRPTKFKTPDDFPSLKGKFRKDLDYQGAVSRSCMHCHQVRDAERQVYRDAGQPIPDKVLFPYPSPRVLGLDLDPRSAANVQRVATDSIADKAGLKTGDRLIVVAGQAIVSQADVQWALHHAPAAGELAVTVVRNDETVKTTLQMPKGWRNATDISWRVTSWSLRRMVTGGILFESASAEQRRRAGIPDGQMALFAKHVGQHGKHAVAKRAGFRKGDIVVSFNGLKKEMTPSQLLGYGASKTRPGQVLPVTVARGKQRLNFKLRMQK